MAGSNIRAFTVSASGVTIKNLTIKNANYGGSGGATYFSSSGTVTGCNFTKNKATGNYSYGGAVHFSGSGIVINSNFDYNIVSEDGGAINMVSGTVSNCNFVNNSANSEGGAIRMYSGTVTDCNFVNNSAKIYGGAVFFGDIDGNGKMSNCIFTNNKVTGEDSRGVQFTF